MTNGKFEQMGKATLLAGMVYMVERMQAIVDEFRAEVEGFDLPVKRKRGRPKGSGAAKALQAVPASRSSPLPAMIGGHHVVQHVARELGYKDTWGLTLWMRTHGMKHRQVKPEGRGGRKINVITEAQYAELKRLRNGEAA